MYERYAQPGRYAVFYATWYARLGETETIDSIHLLKGLMYKEEFRSNSIFQLREHFLLYCSCPSQFATSKDVPERKTFLTNEVKRILTCTVWETDMLGDYWIDTEHLLLGILKERNSVAAEYLARTGLTLKDARRMVLENKPSRPDYGPVSPWWKTRSPLDNRVNKWRMRKYQRENE